MPTYQYRCGACGHDLEAVQAFSDDPLTRCPACGADELRKRYGSVGVVFKGSGFYRTDSRADAKSGSGATSAKSETTGEKPAAAKESGKPATSAGGGSDGGSSAKPAASSTSSSTTGSAGSS